MFFFFVDVVALFFDGFSVLFWLKDKVHEVGQVGELGGSGNSWGKEKNIIKIYPMKSFLKSNKLKTKCYLTETIQRHKEWKNRRKEREKERRDKGRKGRREDRKEEVKERS